MLEDMVLRGGRVIPGACLSWRAVRSSGPGGQHVNKVSTKVALVFDVAACPSLTDAARDRLRRLAGAARLTAEGAVCLTEQRSRSQLRNLELAQERMLALVEAACAQPKHRTATRPSRGATRRRLANKKLHGEKKQRRKKPSSED